jgi:ATP-binding cassette subfamily F protein 3
VAFLTFDDVTLHLGRRRVFGNIGLKVDAGDRIGLVGPNGSGKTSLLRLVVGELEADGGTISRKRGIGVGYLPQETQSIGTGTVLELLRRRVPGREELLAELGAVEAELHGLPAQGEAEELDRRALELSDRLADLHQRLAHFDSDYQDHVALQILAGLGFAPGDANRPLAELSGGWQMRVLLAALLFVQPDLLLLDEPTNHLDMPSVAWFGAFLRRYARPFLLICHDREFLDEQVNRIVSLEPEGLRQYAGNYTSYRRLRAEEEQVLANRAHNLQRERDRAERFIERFRAKNTKARAVKSRIKALERMGEVTELTEHRTISFAFPPTSRTSKQVLRAEGLSRSYGERRALSDVTVSVTAGERIGIIGRNGAGKTTLLRVLAGELAATGGSVAIGAHVRVGYYAQHHAETLAPEATVLESVAAVGAGYTPTQLRTLLGALGFAGEDVDKRIAVLSGGERARVALARLLVLNANLLMMDEPTNHLDLASAERLVEALGTFDGTLIFASHNRAFVRALATQIWNVVDGRVEIYPGTLDEYMTSVVRQLPLPGEDPTPAAAATAPVVTAARPTERERKRQRAEVRALRRERVGPIEQRVREVEERIAALEAEQTARMAELAEPSTYADVQRCAELNRLVQRDARLLEELTAQWERLAGELEEAEALFRAELGGEEEPAG